MKILVLGGTVFLGRYIVEGARAEGHEVTLFNRGRHNPDLFPDVEKLRGDRNGDVGALRGRAFDVVIDTSGYRPDQVLTVTGALDTPSINRYIFISSISVYRAFPPGRSFNEDAPVSEGSEGYGPAKARCEDALLALLPGRVSCVRPGLIVGPHDPTDRFTYWPRRVRQGGQVLAPGRPERPVQFIDVRDLGEWCLRLAAINPGAILNAIGPTLAMSDLLQTCKTVSGSDADLVWVPDATLLHEGVSPWSELPLWIPEDDAESGGMLLAENRRAVDAGLTFRPLKETVRATLEWDLAEGATMNPSPIRVTPITREREAAVLETWHSRD